MCSSDLLRLTFLKELAPASEGAAFPGGTPLREAIRPRCSHRGKGLSIKINMIYRIVINDAAARSIDPFGANFDGENSIEVVVHFVLWN